jgi:hypothetical protein
MERVRRTKYPEMLHIRITTDEKRDLDLLMNDLQTNKSQFIREKLRRILKSKSEKS